MSLHGGFSLSRAGIQQHRLWSASARNEAAAVAGPSAERAAVTTVALATMLAPLNSTLIAVALPHVIMKFGADVAAEG